MNWNIDEVLYPGPSLEEDILTLYLHDGKPNTMSSRDVFGKRGFTFFCANPPSYRFAGELARVVVIDPFQVLFVGYVTHVDYDYNVPFITGRQDPVVQVTMVESEVHTREMPRWVGGL